MRIFITGATGFIGTAVVRELISSGHQVTGLCRSEEKAGLLAAAGATVHRGSLEDPDSLAQGAARADGVIHLAFNHDFSRFKQNCEDDRRTIQILASALAGTDKPLIVTSGIGIANPPPGQLATEDSPVIASADIPRAASEEAAADALAHGANVSVVRLPQVHDTARQGLITYMVALAREKGVLAYIREGGNRWSAAHVTDVARLYRLAVERAAPGAKYHAVAEEGVPLREIAHTLGRRLGLPVQSLDPTEAAAYFGWLAMFAQHDVPASSALTRAALGWQPNGPGLLADLERLQDSAH